MFKVYWTLVDNTAHSADYDELKDALRVCETLRRHGYSFVTMVSENPNVVGKPGVDSIKNGICPDGIPYDWNKRSRIGGVSIDYNEPYDDD